MCLTNIVLRHGDLSASSRVFFINQNEVPLVPVLAPPGMRVGLYSAVFSQHACQVKLRNRVHYSRTAYAHGGGSPDGRICDFARCYLYPFYCTCLCPCPILDVVALKRWT